MILLVLGRAWGQDAIPLGLRPHPRPFELRFDRDVPHLAAGVGLAGLATVVPTLVGAPVPVVTAESPGFYRDLLFGDLVFDDSHGWAAPTSDLLAGGTAGASVLVPLEVGPGTTARNLGRSLIQTEVLLVNFAATSALKFAVHGARPFVQAGRCTDVGSETLACVSDGNTSWVSYSEAQASFPSGHTSWTAASTFGWVTVRLRATDRFGWDDVVLYGVAAGLTTLAGVARVEAGVHHPTDVIAGGLLGAAVGIGVPLLH